MSMRALVLDQVRTEIRSQSLSSAKAKRVLGWEAHYDLKRGLAETVSWYRGFFAQGSERDVAGQPLLRDRP
ncbi:hypothetical protein ACFL59_02640 [Planctomycetota bacterium]